MRDYVNHRSVDPETEATVSGLITGLIIGLALWGMVILAVLG
jgi:hypothetical protein